MRLARAGQVPHSLFVERIINVASHHAFLPSRPVIRPRRTIQTLCIFFVIASVNVAQAQAPLRVSSPDGIGFRYEVGDAGLGDFEMTDELTEFAIADDARAWWIHANVPRPDRYEDLFSASPVSNLDTVQTPLTLELQNGVVAVIHEANLVDYAGLNLAGRFESRTLRAALAPWADGVKVRGRAPFVTPWRTIQLAERVEDLAPSVLGLKLNPPSQIANSSWITPMKYDGIWWGMHLNIYTWS